MAARSHHVEHLLSMGCRFCETAALPVGHAADEHIFQNVHWGLELVLKAYLHAHGWTDERCITKVRHDIAFALAACQREGLRSIDDRSRSFVEALSPFSKIHRVAEFVAARAGDYSADQAIAAAGVICDAVTSALSGKPAGERLSPAPEPVISADPFCGASPRNAREQEGRGCRRDGLRVEREAPDRPVAGDLR